jgi:transcriptional regulator with XRE-family HTH domain
LLQPPDQIGYLSDIERGLARPSVATLKAISDHLGLLLLDVVTFPDEDERQKLTDRLRSVTPGGLRRLVREVGTGRPK